MIQIDPLTTAPKSLTMVPDTKRESLKENPMKNDITLDQIAEVLAFARTLEVQGTDPYIVLFFRKSARILLQNQ